MVMIGNRNLKKYTDEIFCMADFMDPSRYIEFVAYFIQSRQIDVMVVTNSYDGYYMLPWLRMHFPELVIVDYITWRNGIGKQEDMRELQVHKMVYQKNFVCNSATRKVMTDIFDCDLNVLNVCISELTTITTIETKRMQDIYNEKLNLDKQRPIVLFPCRFMNKNVRLCY